MPEADKLLALAKAFGATNDELLSGDDPAGAVLAALYRKGNQEP